MADFLLEEGASLGGYDLDNNPSTDQLQDALHITVQGQSQTLTQRLIDQGVKPDTSDILYGTLLQLQRRAPRPSLGCLFRPGQRLIVLENSGAAVP